MKKLVSIALLALAAATPVFATNDLVDGKVRKVDKEGALRTLKHGDTKTLGMPPMTMAIPWNIDQRFDQLVEVAPGKSTELCSHLPKGAQVRWSYEAPMPLDFDIHAHVGEKVADQARHALAARAEGTLAVALDQDYCWMWTNSGPKLAKVRVKLAR
jgi:hypothetical protein